MFKINRGFFTLKYLLFLMHMQPTLHQVHLFEIEIDYTQSK
jgi:hypothetical protein